VSCSPCVELIRWARLHAKWLSVGWQMCHGEGVGREESESFVSITPVLTIYLIELSMKCPKLGTKWKVRMKIVHRAKRKKKKGDQTSFLNQIGLLHRSFIPSSGICFYLVLFHCWLIYFTKSKSLVRIRSCKLMNWYPVSWNGTQFCSLYITTLKLGMKQG
jgi:hypothetical protein